MPGQPFLMTAPSYADAQLGPSGRPGDPAAAGSLTVFIVWLVVIGIIIPALVLGGLRAGGFQFVFKRR